MAKNILDMYLMPIIEDNHIEGYDITWIEAEAVFRVRYQVDQWDEIDENGFTHSYADFNVKDMEILGLGNETFQYVRVADSLDRYLIKYMKEHYSQALSSGYLDD